MHTLIDLLCSNNEISENVISGFVCTFIAETPALSTDSI